MVVLIGNILYFLNGGVGPSTWKEDMVFETRRAPDSSKYVILLCSKTLQNSTHNKEISFRKNESRDEQRMKNIERK